MNTLRFLKAEQTRQQITKQQLQYITSMYQSIADEFAVKIENLSDKSNISSILKTQYLREYQKELADQISKLNRVIESNIKDGMKQVAQSVVDDEVSRVLSFGLTGISGKFSNIPQDVVETIVSGQLYQSDWSLSSAIWGTNKKIQQDCQNIVARGIAANKGVYEVAKDLEAYVNPSAKKDYKWSRDYPGSNKVVDYNASRLARTMMSHAYQESFERATEDDPWVEAYQWNTAHNTRICPYCQQMSTEDKFNLGPGIYPKGDVPLDHPNGQCFITIVQNKSSAQVVDDIVNWYNGTGDPEMNAQIDKFAQSFGYKRKSSSSTITKPVPKPTTPKVAKPTTPKAGVATKGTTTKVEPKATKKASAKPNNGVVKEPTLKKIKSSSGFIKEFKMGDASVKRYTEALRSTSPEFQNAFVNAMSKKVKKWEHVSETSYYGANSHTIGLRDGVFSSWRRDLKADSPMMHQRQTLFHEIGHAMDDLMPGTNNKYSKSTKYGFKQAMLEDMKNINDACLNGDKAFIDELNKVCLSDSSGGVQDALSAMKCKGIGLDGVEGKVNYYWGHSQEYYEREDAVNEAASELFANMCGAQVDEIGLDSMKKYFPNAYKSFENIIVNIGSKS